MKLKLGNKEYNLVSLRREYYNKASHKAEESDYFSVYAWDCEKQEYTTKKPDPIILLESNFLIYADDYQGKRPDLVYEVIREFTQETGLVSESAVNTEIQKKVGKAKVEIPVQKIVDVFGKKYCLKFSLKARYYQYALFSGPETWSTNLILSVPHAISMIVWPFGKCIDGEKSEEFIKDNEVKFLDRKIPVIVDQEKGRKICRKGKKLDIAYSKEHIKRLKDLLEQENKNKRDAEEALAALKKK